MSQKPVQIDTKRLTLRTFTRADAEYMHKNWARDPEVVRFLVYDRCQTIEDVHSRLDDWYAYFAAADGQWQLFAIELKECGEVIGTIDYCERDAEAGSAEIGYQLGKAWWGKGYMTEAVGAVVKYCFEQTELNRVWAVHDSRNRASGRVLQKAGMKWEGELRQCAVRRGERVNTVYYSALRDEYLCKKEEIISIVPYEHRYFGDMLFCYLSAKDAVGVYAPEERWTAPTLKEDLLDINGNYLERGEAFYLAIDTRGRVVGMLGTKTVSPGQMWLKRFFIKPELKGRGIGGRLLGKVEAFAMQKGIAELHTRFADWYREAAAFYPAKGFEPAPPEGGLRHMTKKLPE